MSNVALLIGGRSFTVACADGEEDHVRDLGAIIQARIEQAGVAGQSESRMLLFAALLLADELHEHRKSGASNADLDEETCRHIEAIAATLENLAQRLESEAGSA